ncbi:hypothetical protein OC846_000830 [Tilletia horrida]|uniref:Borealin N-terminal domain-containing protein n=1 Tax=Tilletia horrida TaxID=155126 RepID=A0AAN6H075_9BASI|nr:hypothetical protein OC845_002328 [Tilletia horrida]KAK0556985.1 hypothetical protein OC846_000830 [Tilletia horrida]KAK0566679.1 hypothetical protein OC861_003120 [Tilletia horrida]
MVRSSPAPASSSLFTGPDAEAIFRKPKTAKKKKAMKQHSSGDDGSPLKTGKKRKAAANQDALESTIRSLLRKYDIEAERQIRRLTQMQASDITYAQSMSDVRIESIPLAVRQATLESFLREGKGNIQTFLGRQPTQHMKQSQEEWEHAKKRKAWPLMDIQSPGPSSDAAGPNPASSSGVFADAEASPKKTAKNPPMTRKTTTKSARAAGAGSSAKTGRSTRRASFVLRTQEGKELDVDAASSSQLQEIGLSESDAKMLRDILQRMQ